MSIKLKDYDEYKRIFSDYKLIRSGNSCNEFWVDLYELEEDNFPKSAAVIFENPDGYYKNIAETGHMIICNNAGEQNIEINTKYFKWKDLSFDDVYIGDVLLDLEDNMFLIIDEDTEAYYDDDYEECVYRYCEVIDITNIGIEKIKKELCEGIEYDAFKNKYNVFDMYDNHKLVGNNFEYFEPIRIDRIKLKKETIIKALQ